MFLTLELLDDIVMCVYYTKEESPHRSMKYYFSPDSRESPFFSHHYIRERLSDILDGDTIVFTMDIILFEDIIYEHRTDGLDLVPFHTSHVDLFFIFLILDISEHFLEDIFHRHDSGSPTMLIEHESDMTTRLLEFLEEVIERLSQWYFHDLLEIESRELHLSMSLFLHLECFTKGDDIVYIVSRFPVYWDT